MIDALKMTQDELRQRVTNGGLSDAEVAAANSDEHLTAALNEFAQRVRNIDQLDWRAGQEIANIARSRHPIITADALVEAYEMYAAANMSKEDLRYAINQRAQASSSQTPGPFNK